MAGRPKGSANVTALEAMKIRRLFREGVRVVEIATTVGRGEAVVRSLTRDLKRKKPPPPKGRHAERNDRILLLVKEGLSRAEIGQLVGLTATRVSQVVIEHPHIEWLLRVRKLKPATVAARYRLELSSCLRIAQGKSRSEVKRTWSGSW